MNTINRALITIENGIAGVCLIGAVSLAILSIVLRAGFDVIIFWSEEAIIYLVIFSTFFGAIITLRDNEHVNVDILPALMNKGGKKVMALIGGAVTVAYMGIVAVLGWLLLTEPFSFDTVTPALKLPLGAVETALPVAFTLMLLRAIVMLWSTWTRGVEDLSAADVARLEAEAAGVSAADIIAAQSEMRATLEERQHPHGTPGRPEQDIGPQAEIGNDHAGNNHDSNDHAGDDHDRNDYGRGQQPDGPGSETR